MTDQLVKTFKLVTDKQFACFEYAPESVENRVHSIILRQDENRNAYHCLSNLKKLFEDSVQVIHQRYPDLDLPIAWK